jgi:hypothetical protein
MEAEAALALRRAGFDLVSLANNHILDCGAEGLRETRQMLQRASVTPFGAGLTAAAAHQPARVRLGGIRLAFLGYLAPRVQIDGRRASLEHLTATPDRAGAAAARPDLMRRDIGSVRVNTDIVIVVLHMGGRYQRRPLPDERALAQAAIDAGADAVVAHGPHILGPIARYRGRPIFYSVGNFAFGSGNVFARFSLMAFLEIDPEHKRIAAVQALPIYTVNYNPWIGFQAKVLVGHQARRVLRDLADRSQELGTRLALVGGPERARLVLAPGPAASTSATR